MCAFCGSFGGVDRDLAYRLDGEEIQAGVYGQRHAALGYVHSVVITGDGFAQDCWGEASLRTIADRYGIAEFGLSRQEHLRVVSALCENSPRLYEKAFEEAKLLINQHLI